MPFSYTSDFKPEGELVLWRVAESADWYLDQLSLSANMWREYQAISAPNVQLQWLASRFALQQVAKRRELEVVKDKHGKPFLVQDERFISLSHCQGYAAAIAATQPVGVDVEIVSNRVQRIKDRFLTADEQSILGTEDAGLMLGWSAKEAVYKLHGARGLVFKEHMLIEAHLPERQALSLRLTSNELDLVLPLHYIFQDGCVLVWVCQPD